MRPTRRVRSLGSWIAMLAFLVATFAPALGHALTSDAAGPWAELCNAKGNPPAPAGEPAQHLLEHCPVCGVHLDAMAAPPAPTSLELPCTPAASPPAAFLNAPHTLHAWVRAQPRAPPVPA